MADYATLNLRIKNNQFNRGIDQSMGKLNGLGKTALKIGSAIGAYLGGRELVRFATSSIKAANAQEAAIKKLNASLQINGENVDRLSPKYQRFSAQMQQQTVYGDELILQQMAYGRNLGITSDKLEAATTAAAGLAAKFGLDLKTAMMLVGRASQGQTQMLTRYGITLDDTLGPQEKFNQLLKIGADNFGLAQAETDTLTGKTMQLSNAWGDLKEALGKVLIENGQMNNIVDSLTSKIASATAWVTQNAGAIQYMFGVAGIELKTFGKDFMAFLDLSLGNVGRMFTWVYDNFTKMLTNSYDIGVAVFTDFFNYYKNFWSGMVDVASGAWDLIKAVITGGDVSAAFDNLINKAVGGAANVIGSMGTETEKALKKAGVTELKLKSAGDFADDVAKNQIAAEKAKLKLYNDMQASIGKASSKGVGSKKSEEEQAKKSADKLASAKTESTLTDAIEKGSMEALKLSSTQVTRDDKLLKKNEETAKNTKDTVNEVKKLNKNLSYGGLQTVDAFA